MALVLTNARILAGADAWREVEAIAMADGRVLAVGSASEVRAASGAGSRVVDLNGALVAPGFNDSHMHILWYGLTLLMADLSPAAGVRSVPALVEALQRWRAANPGSEWVLGGRYDQNTFPGASHPVRADLDEAFPVTPVYISQTSGHAGVANSVALRLAGIDATTVDPPGGAIVRDARGEPTGLLLEDAMDRVTARIPEPTRAEQVEAIARACERLVANGITAASEMSLGSYGLAAEVDAYLRTSELGAPVRMTLHPLTSVLGLPDGGVAFKQAAHDLGLPATSRPGVGGVRLGGAKLFVDGALTVRTAALRRPFVDGSGSGMLLHDPDRLRAIVRAAHLLGWQVCAHAIGDRAVDEALCAIEAAQSVLARVDARHRVEHAMVLGVDLIERMAAGGIVADLQPEFLARLGDAYVMGLGAERAASVNPAASLVAAGVAMAFGSDCPVVPGAPLAGIAAAAARRTPSGVTLGPNEAISPLEALRCYTGGAAFAEFDDQQSGSLEFGRRADAVVLRLAEPDAPLDRPETWASAAVETTLVGGVPVYGADALD
ncbi:MAG: amidohydrolase [Armatimonadetes bacterium]|nr:amidohydrolase [Armatimonadota bacterium]